MADTDPRADGLLPGWEATDDAAALADARPRPDRRPARPPGTFGLRILNVSEVARAIREAVRADRAWPTSGSRARSAGSRSAAPGTRTSR